MKAQVLKMREASGTSKKTGQPYNGYFITLVHEDGEGGLDAMNTFIDKAAAPGILAPDTVVDVVQVLGSSRIAKIVASKDEPFLMRV